jgi:hypothetical protein
MVIRPVRTGALGVATGSATPARAAAVSTGLAELSPGAVGVPTELASGCWRLCPRATAALTGSDRGWATVSTGAAAPSTGARVHRLADGLNAGGPGFDSSGCARSGRGVEGGGAATARAVCGGVSLGVPTASVAESFVPAGRRVVAEEVPAGLSAGVAAKGAFATPAAEDLANAVGLLGGVPA